MEGRLLGGLNRAQREWLLLISACLVKAAAGQCLSGAVYADYFKSKLNMSQREIDLSLTLLFMGSVLSLLAGIVHDTFGSRAAVAASGLLSTTTCASLALAFSHSGFLRNNLWLLNLLMFVYGHSFNYSYLAAIATCMATFNKRGSVMTLLDTCFVLGTPIVALLYYVVCDNMNGTVQSPFGTMTTLACGNAVVHIFAFCFLAPVNQEGGDCEHHDMLPILPDGSQGKKDETESEDKTEQDFKHTWCSLLSARFILLLFGFSLTMAPNSAMVLNLTSITRSLSLSGKNLLLFWVPALVSVCWRFLIGPLTDKLTPLANQRAAVMSAAAGILNTIGCMLLTAPIAGPSLVTAMAAYIALFVSGATLFTLMPVLLALVEPPSVFGRMYSGCLLLTTGLTMPLMLQFGIIFDAHSHRLADNSTELECFGSECYTQANVANLTSNCVGIASLIAYTIILWRQAVQKSG